MPTRNTPVLQSIIECLGDQIALPQDALARLEGRFNDSLLIVAGAIQNSSQARGRTASGSHDSGMCVSARSRSTTHPHHHRTRGRKHQHTLP